ncbi:MAG: MoaD/ThiS family protein [Asgard group archaeon]|nr:MoaD/ThiS family protein [Asgard group archaeon]
MSGSESGKSSIMKYVPEESMELKAFLLKVGIKNLDRHTILVNGARANLDQLVEKNDEIIVLPILKGG